MSSTNPRFPENQQASFLRVGIEELKSIKVAIMRRNISDPDTTGPLFRSLDDPTSLVIHYRSDEGVRPIFDREDVMVNKDSQEERMIMASGYQAYDRTSHPPLTSRSSSRSSHSSEERIPKKDEKKRLSPQPHSSRDRSKEDYRGYASKTRRGSPTSRIKVYKSSSPPRPSCASSRKSKTPQPLEPRKQRERSPPGNFGKSRTPPRYYSKTRHSRSPLGFRSFTSEKRRSRSPPSKSSDKARTAPKYRSPLGRRRSRSPPPKKHSRGRSRSYSPHYRSRYSKSPYRRGERRYESFRRSPRRSRSPRRRYTSESREPEMYDPTRMPHPYFEGAEFWIPNPMLQPRFVPRQMIPPGAFPYFRPRMPPMIPPRIPFRPPIVYNRPPRPKIIPSTSAAAIENPVVSITTTSISKESDEHENKATTITDGTRECDVASDQIESN